MLEETPYVHPNSLVPQLICLRAQEVVRHPAFDRSDQQAVEYALAVELQRQLPVYRVGQSFVATFICRVIDEKSKSLIQDREAQLRDFCRLAESVNEMMNDCTEVARHSGTVARPYDDASRTVREHGEASDDRTPQPQPLEIGEMVFSKVRVELCGVKVCGGAGYGLIREILDVLRNKTSQGQHKPYSGEELAQIVGCRGGQNGVAGAIRDFRVKVAELLLAEASIQCDRDQDIIVNDRRYGYRLSPKIVDRDVDDPHRSPNDPQGDKNDPVNDLDHDLDHHATDDLNGRQTWILEQTEAGLKLTVGQVVDQFECSKVTARRDLTDLRDRGLIVFEGAPRTGFWQKPAENQATAR